MRRVLAAAALAAIFALTGCGGGTRTESSPATTAQGPLSVEQTCALLFDKGDDGRFFKAMEALSNLPNELTVTNVSFAVISAGDLKYVAGTATDDMKDRIKAVIVPLEAIAPGPNKVQPGDVKAAEAKVLEACPERAKDYNDDKEVKAARDKAAADIAARKAGEAAAAKAAADAAAAKEAADEAAAKAPKEYSGAGADIVNITKPGTGSGPAVAVITHSGWSNFAVHTLDKALNSTDLLVNTIGNYSGTVLFDERTSTGETTALKITADGAWTVKLVPFSSIRSFDGSTPMTGHGDDVFAYTGAAKAATFTHNGSRNIAVKAYGTRADLLINEIGPYTGTVVWAPGIYEVTADGDWSATLR